MADLPRDGDGGQEDAAGSAEDAIGASAPIPKFATAWSTLGCDFGIEGH
jgi:hypothetical protein